MCRHLDFKEGIFSKFPIHILIVMKCKSIPLSVRMIHVKTRAKKLEFQCFMNYRYDHMFLIIKITPCIILRTQDIKLHFKFKL